MLRQEKPIIKRCSFSIYWVYWASITHDMSAGSLPSKARFISVILRMCFCRFCQLQVTTVQVSIDPCRRIQSVAGAVKGHWLLNVHVTFKRSEWSTFTKGRGSLSVFTEALSDSLFGDRSHIWCCCIWSQLNHWEKPPSLLAIASTAKPDCWVTLQMFWLHTVK